MARPIPRYKPGDRIGGRYLVHKALLGGMGEVYLCLDLKENYPYALKTFQQRYQSSALRKAFETEVATWIALENHPNIVRCFHLDIIDNQPFVVTEWVAGEEGKGADLRAWLRHGPLDLQKALNITIDVTKGLLHAQEKQPGLVHRDVKPENILIAQTGLAKVTDFGLAQIAEYASLEVVEIGTVTNTEELQSLVRRRRGIVGTPAYMAPEQWRREPLDERTDIYALGCVFYEMLTGHRPFQVSFSLNSQQQWLNRMQAAHENEVISFPDRLSAELVELLTSCLGKMQSERPASMNDLLIQLTHIYKQQFNRPPPDRPTPSTFKADDYNNRAVTYNNLKRYDQALTDFTRAIALNPNLVQAYNNRGNTYRALQRYKQALSDYNQALELDPNNADAYNNRGNTYHALQQYETALADYEQAIALDSVNATAYLNRGTTYKELQRYEQALADYNRAIELDPHNVTAYLNRGNVYTDLQQYEATLADYDRVLNLDPNSAQAYYNRGNAYQSLQRYEEALVDYDRALSLDPNLAQAYYNRGNAYQSLQRYEEALVDYDRALSLDPNLAQAYLNRGSTYAALQQYETALTDFNQAINLAPTDATAYFNLAALLVNNGQLQESLPYLQQASRLGLAQARHAIVQVRKAMSESGPASQVDPARAGFEAFQQAGSVEAMGQAMAQFPLMAQADFIAAIEQVIVQQVPPEFRPYFEQRLAWLKQISNEQQG